MLLPLPPAALLPVVAAEVADPTSEKPPAAAAAAAAAALALLDVSIPTTLVVMHAIYAVYPLHNTERRRGVKYVCDRKRLEMIRSLFVF